MSGPTKRLLESLRFWDDHVDPVSLCEVCSEGEAHVFADGSPSYCCTNHAAQVVNLYPHLTEIVGFRLQDNPVEHPAFQSYAGHDFAIVSGRYIVDHWLRDVAGDDGPMVLDLEDPSDHFAIRYRYGDPLKWETLAGPRSETKAT